MVTQEEVWHLTKSKRLDSGLYAQILQHANLYITVFYAEIWEGNFGEGDMAELPFDRLHLTELPFDRGTPFT